MVFVIVAPTVLAGCEYVEIPKINDIRPLQLLLVEEKLDGMISRLSKLVKDTSTRVSCMKDFRSQLENITAQYANISTLFPTHSLDTLLDSLEIKISELLKCSEDQGCSSPSTQKKTPEKHMFVDSLHFLVSWRMRKKFTSLFDPNIIVLLKATKEEAIYKVYCLKKETGIITETVRNVLRRDANLISEGVAQRLIEEGDSEDDRREKERLRVLLVQSVELLVFITILRGFAEAVNKYGLPPDFKYKITERVDREIKRLKKSAKCTKEEIGNSIAIVEIPTMY